MKRIALLWALIALFMPHEGADAQQMPSGKKMLVAYFSHSGNTRQVAEQIARSTGADLFEIVPATAYPADYHTVVDQAKKELNVGLRPALKSAGDISGYDVVFVGSPCWWSTVAPPVATFLSSHDFAGKTVVPFMTHEGSRMGRSEEDIRKLCPAAELKEGLPIRGGQAGQAAPAVDKWLRKIGLK